MCYGDENKVFKKKPLIRFNITQHSKLRILITPLDWGLGHATRCIPVIEELLNRGYDVSIATSGGALSLLKREFPQLTYCEIVSYKAQYQASGSFLRKLIGQTPKFLKAIAREHTQIKEIVQANSIDLIISDNRYGCWDENVKSIFITHQLNLLPQSSWLIRSVVNRFIISKIKKFDECWIPDLPNSFYSGDLSKNSSVPKRYIGILSRFKSATPLKIKYKLLAIISGPEPQRQIFEDIIRTQYSKVDGSVLMVKGLPERESAFQTTGNLTEVNHLSKSELQDAILSSEFVIVRSGYSSVMDFASLGKKNITMVPTPAQPEQEYLAKKLSEENLIYSPSQDSLDILESIRKAEVTKGFSTSNSANLLSEALASLLSVNSK